MAHGRRTHAERGRSRRETAMAGDADHDRKMAEKVTVHSCIISHNACEQNHIIVLSPPSHIAACRVGAANKPLETAMLTNAATWFITGASSGYGLALARYAIDRGYNVVATARSVAKLATLAALAPDRVLVQKLDVTLPHDAATAVAAATTR